MVTSMPSNFGNPSPRSNACEADGRPLLVCHAPNMIMFPTWNAQIGCWFFGVKNPVSWALLSQVCGFLDWKITIFCDPHRYFNPFKLLGHRWTSCVCWLKLDTTCCSICSWVNIPISSLLIWKTQSFKILKYWLGKINDVCCENISELETLEKCINEWNTPKKKTVLTIVIPMNSQLHPHW